MKATYLVGPRGPEYRRDDQAGTIRWYVYDGLGSVVGEVAPDGTLTRSQSFDVYGCVRTSSGTATTKHKFVGSLGHPSDDETGLIYMRARHYDAVVGRFVSEDPGYNGKNWFTYCGQNPVCGVDPTGKFVMLALIGVFLFCLIMAGEMGLIHNARLEALAKACGLAEVGGGCWALAGEALVESIAVNASVEIGIEMTMLTMFGCAVVMFACLVLALACIVGAVVMMAQFYGAIDSVDQIQYARGPDAGQPWLPSRRGDVECTRSVGPATDRWALARALSV